MGIKFLNGGFLTTIQDMGRTGYQESGMSVSGVMDQRSAALANILVGNDENEGVMEVTLMGPMAEFTADNIIAVTGANLGAKLNGKELPMYQAVQVHKGDSERIGLVGIAVHLIVTVGISHHILSHLSHPSLCGTGHRNSYGAGRIGGLNSLHRLRSCLQGTDYRDAAAVQLFGGRVDKFIACIGGCPKTFGLALEQVQSGENRRLGSAAGHKIDMFQSPRRIYFTFNLADNFFNAHIMFLLSGQPEAAAILLYFYSV